MTGSLSLSSSVQVFPCPTCGETINTSLPSCPFCSSPFDPQAAEQAAIATARISQACSDASYLRVMAWMFPTFFLLMFFPFLGLAGIVGVWFLRVAIPFMVIRWWIKFGSIKTPDPDFPRAKRTVIIVAGVAILALVTVTINIH
jgi:hypothetical protein